MTKVCMQWMVMTATKAMPITPPTSPALLMATGMVNTPIPMFPFSRWITVSALEIVFGRESSVSPTSE